MNIPDGLKARYDEGRLVPFVGAGISRSVEWGTDKHGVSWTELVDQAARIMGFDEPDLLRVRGNDLQILEYYRNENRDAFTNLRDWFVAEMNPTDADLLDSPVLAALAKLTRCQLYYTTNFDNFLERAIAAAGRNAVRISVEEDIARHLMHRENQDRVEVVKFHGDLDYPERMVLSESDYDARMNYAGIEDQRLKSDVIAKAVLFLGYSFRDYNVSYLFRTLNQDWGRLPESLDGRRAFIVLADPSRFEYELFRRRNIEVIGINGRNRTDDLVALLEGLEG